MLTKIKAQLRWKLRGEVPLEHLIGMGLKVGKNLNMQFEVSIDYSHCWLISIGDDVTLAPRVVILAHDTSTKRHLDYTKVGLVEIGNKVFVGAGSIILPNVKIGDNSIIGAGSVVSKDIPPNCIVAGNPARVVGTLDDYLQKNKDLMQVRPVFDHSWRADRNITDSQKEEMIQQLRDGIGYVK